MNYPEQFGLPVELFCNFVDGKPHILSKHDHNKKNFFLKNEIFFPPLSITIPSPVSHK